MEPVVAIVGIPNVGKSTLFNRLVRRRQAIVTDEPGVTRDRQYGRATVGARAIRVVDTGGLTPKTAAPFAREIEAQAQAALDEAAVILFVIDARAERTALDEAVADRLRRSDVPVLLVANKAESPSIQNRLGECYALGLGDPLAVSAEHGLGFAELAAAIEARLPPETGPADARRNEASPVRELGLALVGRPNVGKSSLFNRLVGAERALVSDVPGTTRDSIDTRLEIGGRAYRLIDTAGMRRRGKLRERVERYSVARARQAIERSDVCVLVIDASEPLAAQDTHIAGAILDARKPFVVAINKWDLVTDRERKAKEWMERIRDRLKFAKGVPMVLVSAETGQRVEKLLERAEELHRLDATRVSTPELNRWLDDAARFERGAPAAGRRVNLLYATQTGIHPPTFVVFCSDPRKIHFSMRRYLENSLRARFALESVPLKLVLRGRPKS